jgi:hypothetical protein
VYRGGIVQPEWIVGGIVAAVVLVGLIFQLLPKRKPPSVAFTCARCHKTARHNNRTEQAWRNGNQKLFCDECHRLWLQSRPTQQHASGRPSTGRSGCLGVIALAALLPVGVVLAWLYT